VSEDMSWTQRGLEYEPPGSFLVRSTVGADVRDEDVSMCGGIAVKR
jgi:hypothetical protein